MDDDDDDGLMSNRQPTGSQTNGIPPLQDNENLTRAKFEQKKGLWFSILGQKKTKKLKSFFGKKFTLRLQTRFHFSSVSASASQFRKCGFKSEPELSRTDPKLTTENFKLEK